MIPFVSNSTMWGENNALSMSSTGYGIHIHELSRLCHITVVWVSNQEATHHPDGPSYWLQSFRTMVEGQNWFLGVFRTAGQEAKPPHNEN